MFYREFFFLPSYLLLPPVFSHPRRIVLPKIKTTKVLFIQGVGMFIETFFSQYRSVIPLNILISEQRKSNSGRNFQFHFPTHVQRRARQTSRPRFYLKRKKNEALISHIPYFLSEATKHIIPFWIFCFPSYGFGLPPFVLSQLAQQA